MIGNLTILEDNEDRIREFERAVASLGGFQLHLWRNAHRMIAECLPLLQNCLLISLDHDLNTESANADDPGTGLEVAKFLARQKPICPVIIHTSNTEGRWSMHNELRFGEWTAEIIPPIGEGWIQNSWLPKAKILIVRKPMRILYVENHAAFAETVKQKFLSKHSVTIVPTLSAARERMQKSLFEVLLVDYDLDDGKGSELVLEVCASGKSVAIIGVSSHAEGNVALLQAGAAAICGKTEFDQIQSVIDRITQHRTIHE